MWSPQHQAAAEALCRQATGHGLNECRSGEALGFYAEACARTPPFRAASRQARMDFDPLQDFS